MTRTVCLVDDDYSVQRAVRRLLQSAGYSVLVCSSAVEFLALTELPHPLCVIVDVRMPGMTGTDLQAVLARTRPGLPVIMISGHADSAMMQRSMSAGAAFFLSKPFEENALLDAVGRAMPPDRVVGPVRIEFPG